MRNCGFTAGIYLRIDSGTLYIITQKFVQVFHSRGEINTKITISRLDVYARDILRKTTMFTNNIDTGHSLTVYLILLLIPIRNY